MIELWSRKSLIWIFEVLLYIFTLSLNRGDRHSKFDVVVLRGFLRFAETSGWWITLGLELASARFRRAILFRTRKDVNHSSGFIFLYILPVVFFVLLIIEGKKKKNYLIDPTFLSSSLTFEHFCSEARTITHVTQPVMVLVLTLITENSQCFGKLIKNDPLKKLGFCLVQGSISDWF